MRSLRRQKFPDGKDQAVSTVLNPPTNPNQRYPGATDAGNENPDATGEDWLPPKELLKPEGQLQLTEKELEEELTRILNANNPHAPQNISRYNFKEGTYKSSPNVDHLALHYEFEGYLIYMGPSDNKKMFEDEENVATETDFEGIKLDDKKPLKLLRNRFNFNERAAQTTNNPHRDSTSNTEPPPHKIFSGSVNQWSIYDAYKQDVLAKEKAAKAKVPGKGHKDEDTKPSHTINDHVDDTYYRNSELKKSIRIIERMANQNTYDDIAQDFKYWEDISDEFREGKAGTLLPLWKFLIEKDKKKQVTALSWNPKYTDFFAVGYGSYEFTKQGPGLITCFSLKNPSYPENVYILESGVMCLDFHPQHPSLIAAGLYDGTIVVYDLQKKQSYPIMKSTNQESKHTDPVWQVYWHEDDLDENVNFFSISSDGRITQWTLMKNELVHTDVMRLRLEMPKEAEKKEQPPPEEDKIFGLSGGCCFDFHKGVRHIFVVGTEEGKIYKCSTTYNSQYLLSYEGHQMNVYSIKYNPYHYDVFLSASADWTVKLWKHNEPNAIMTFDLNSPVGDVAWSPYSSTVFAAVTAEGKVVVFDLELNKYEPICAQQIVKKPRLTHVAFNMFEPIVIVGDDKGVVNSLKLSPNLRKVPPGDKEDQKLRLERILAISAGKTFDSAR